MKLEDKEKLKKKATTGAVVLSAKRVLVQIIYSLSNIALARLLFPSDFGTFAIITFVSTLFLVFTDLGLGPALIQKKRDLNSKDLQTAFTIQILLSLTVFIAIFLFSPAIASFYNLGTKGVALFRIYSLYFLLNPFKTSSGAQLERHLEYQKLTIIEIGEILVASSVTVALAFSGFGVFSFAIGAVAGHLTGAALYFSFAPWKIGLAINLKNLSNLTKFGLPFQGSVILGLFYGPAILLYLGKIVGTQNLGFYQFAASLSVLPLAISEILNRIIFPLVARVQEDRVFLRRLIELSILTVSATTLPIVFVMLAAAPNLIHFIYTDRWMPSLPALYLGIVQMGIISFTGIFSQFLLALGYSSVMRNIGIVWAILTWILAPLLISTFNFVGMSLAALLVSLSGIWLLFKLQKEVSFSFTPNFYPFFSVAFVAGLIVFVFLKTISLSLSMLILTLSFGLVLYLSLIWLYKRDLLKDNLQILRKIIIPF